MVERSRCTLICILGGDLVEQGAALGPRTKACDTGGATLVRELEEQGRSALIVVTPGRADKHGKSDKYPKQPATMARMMQQHLISLGVRNDLIVTPPPVWGTKAELAAVKNVIESPDNADVEIEEVLVVCADWHAPRVKMNIIELGLSRLAPVTIRTVKDKIFFRDFVIEDVKIVLEWVRINIPGSGAVMRFVRGRD